MKLCKFKATQFFEPVGRESPKTINYGAVCGSLWDESCLFGKYKMYSNRNYRIKLVSGHDFKLRPMKSLSFGAKTYGRISQ